MSRFKSYCLYYYSRFSHGIMKFSGSELNMEANSSTVCVIISYETAGNTLLCCRSHSFVNFLTNPNRIKLNEGELRSNVQCKCTM